MGRWSQSKAKLFKGQLHTVGKTPFENHREVVKQLKTPNFQMGIKHLLESQSGLQIRCAEEVPKSIGSSHQKLAKTSI